MAIHPSAIVSDNAKIHPEATIGPFVVIRGQVDIAKGVVLDQFATIGADHTEVTIGEGTRVFPGAVVGEAPQDLKYAGETAKVFIGRQTMVREYVTIHAGTPQGGGTML